MLGEKLPLLHSTFPNCITFLYITIIKDTIQDSLKALIVQLLNVIVLISHLDSTTYLCTIICPQLSLKTFFYFEIRVCNSSGTPSCVLYIQTNCKATGQSTYVQAGQHRFGFNTQPHDQQLFQQSTVHNIVPNQSHWSSNLAASFDLILFHVLFHKITQSNLSST